MGLRTDIGVNNSGYTMRLLYICLLLVASSSAEFEEISDVTFDGEPGIWNGAPTVDLENHTHVQICANHTSWNATTTDTYWNTDMADTICQYFGFTGSMIIEVMDFAAPGFAMCKKEQNNTDSRLQLSCKFLEVCVGVPIISCLLPGYEGCYTQTATDPFFTNGSLADLGDQQVNIQTCAEACSDSPYLGLTNGSNCICGSGLGNRSLVGDCDLGCQGDDLQQCGGEEATSVYSASVIGQCESERVEIIPDQPHYITSPNFPDIYEANVSCSWILDINVPLFHDLEIITTFDFEDDNIQHLDISSESNLVELTPAGTSGTTVLSRTPYSTLQDTITVSLTPSSGGNSTIFVMKFTLMSNTMYTPANDYTTAPPPESTTSKAGQNVNLGKLAMSAGLGVILAAILLV
eukprot:XP_011677591.1 PREDICTED: kremen protein 2-like [Strongylocentrotus purpuratus]